MLSLFKAVGLNTERFFTEAELLDMDAEQRKSQGLKSFDVLDEDLGQLMISTAKALDLKLWLKIGPEYFHSYIEMPHFGPLPLVLENKYIETKDDRYLRVMPESCV
jgi:hypothetical protein